MKPLVVLLLATLANCDFDYDVDKSLRLLLFSSAAYRVGKSPTPLEFLSQELPGQVTSLQTTSQPCQFESVCPAIVAHISDGSVVVAFRGTETPMQLIDEITNTVRPRVTSDIGGLVQPFFQEAHERLWPDVFRFVNDYIGNSTAHDIYVTGHSLGGALAALFAGKLVNGGYVPADKVKVITFGEPRVGNSEYATEYDALVPQTWRVIHYRDIVPHIPPCNLLPWKTCSNDSYTSYYYHHGTEVFYGMEYMSANSSYKICKGLPINEDKDCSNALVLSKPCFNVLTCVNDHLVYFGMEVAFWKIPLVANDA